MSRNVPPTPPPAGPEPAIPSRDPDYMDKAMHGLAEGSGYPTTGRHPAGLYLLFIVEMWERFSYYGMRAILVLYLIREMGVRNPGRGWSDGDATLLYGWYTGLAYLTPVLGGILADKFIGTHRSMILGGLIIALGHIVLALSGIGEMAHNDLGMSVFIGGLALIVLGTGHFKPCVSVMVGQLYPPKDPRRDGAFTIFYMGINLGAFICPFVCGTLGESERFGWHWGFGAAAVGMIAGLITYLLARPKYLAGIGLPPPGRPNITVLLGLGSIALAALVGLVFHLGFFGGVREGIAWLSDHRALAITVWSALAALVVGAVAWFVASQERDDRGPVACIFIFMLFNAFFWIAFEQAGSTLNIFAERSTDRTIGSWEMPASWFQSVNPLLIILLAPAFAMLWSALGRRDANPSQPVKIGLGLLLLGAGYLFMVAAGGINADGTQVAMFWLLGTYFLHTLGELCLSPTGLSFVTKAAPVRFVSLLMGVWFISSFLANLGGGIVGSYIEEVEDGRTQLPWSGVFGGRGDFFALFVVSSFAAGLLILILTPFLKKMLHGRG